MIFFLRIICCLFFATIAHAEDFPFAFSQKILLQEEGNVFISPYSVHTSLRMALDGAYGKTARQMQKVLGTKKKPLEVDDSFHSFQAMAVDSSLDLRKEYIDTIQTIYQAATLSVDFQEPQKAISSINNWVAQATDNRLLTLVQQNDIQKTTRLMLLNAVLFTGEWLLPFNKENTQEAPFTTHEGTQVMVPMMYQEAMFQYGSVAGAKFLALDCKDSHYGCMIVLPAGEKSLQDIEKKFTLEALTSWRASLRKEYVKLFLPKVTIDYRLDCKEALKSLGMGIAFSRDADFSRISPTPLAIDTVLHGTHLKLDETGIEATAATAVSFIIKSTLPPENAIEMRCDHPFLLLIYDKAQDALLFVGRVSQP